MDKIRVLLVDDHQVLRDGLRHMLALEDDIEVVGEASSERTALAQAEALSPDVILMDIKMPGTDGLELTRQIKRQRPACNIIIFTFYDEYLPQAIEAGAIGYLNKDIKREDLARAIRAVREGRSPLAVSVSQDGLCRVAGTTESAQRPLLSERELAVLRLVAQGVTTDKTASQLFWSQASVKRSISVIFRKLGAHNRCEAVAEAYKRNLI